MLAFVIMTVICLTPFGDCHLRGKPMMPLILLGLFQPVIYFIGEQYGILHELFSFPGLIYCVMILIGIYGILNADDSGVHEKRWSLEK